MDFDSDSLAQHCQTILKSRRILRKIVILCEGDIQSFESCPSPQSYRQNGKMPDASFYKACVPENWTQRRPEFFNCGGRGNVLQTYFELLKRHENDPENSYLNPEKLFAIVDLDFTPQPIENYAFSSIDEIFHNLYDRLDIKSEMVESHRIFVTGFVHKEGYFLIPDLQETFEKLLSPPHYQASPESPSTLLNLQGIYHKMAIDLTQDKDLEKHWDRVHPRISNHFPGDYSTPAQFSQDWLIKFKSCRNKEEKLEPIYKLLTLRKAKDYWKDCVVPPEDYSLSSQTYRDNLALEIGKFYSKNSNNPRYHIPFLLNCLM
jgi:hypothetical protein